MATTYSQCGSPIRLHGEACPHLCGPDRLASKDIATTATGSSWRGLGPAENAASHGAQTAAIADVNTESRHLRVLSGPGSAIAASSSFPCRCSPGALPHATITKETAACVTGISGVADHQVR